ncbi:MAG: hypothetical protein IIC02_08420 [Planctomycetes bacterium]|nr:hypothetical protein [Planctomycetota bacterium]
MQSFRVDMLGEKTLRLHDPHNKLLAERELTPDAIRLRKRLLKESDRRRAQRKR